jgi:hypothetical protein
MYLSHRWSHFRMLPSMVSPRPTLFSRTASMKKACSNARWTLRMLYEFFPCPQILKNQLSSGFA